MSDDEKDPGLTGDVGIAKALENPMTVQYAKDDFELGEPSSEEPSVCEACE